MKLLSIVLTLIVTSLSGCSLLYNSADRGAKGIGKGVTYYCENTDEYVREQFGVLVNTYAAPNAIVITCANGYKLDSATTETTAPVLPTP